MKKKSKIDIKNPVKFTREEWHIIAEGLKFSLDMAKYGGLDRRTKIYKKYINPLPKILARIGLHCGGMSYEKENR